MKQFIAECPSCGWRCCEHPHEDEATAVKHAQDHICPKEGRVQTTWKAPNGRVLVPGTEVKIMGERGRFRFVKYVRAENGAEWCEFIGGTKGVVMWRAFRPERIGTVHRTQQTLSLQEARKLVVEKKRVKRVGKKVA